APRNSGSPGPKLRMSRVSSAKSGLLACWETLASRPPTRLSMARTENPLSRRRSTRWLPMNPAPPVTTAIDFIATGGAACRDPRASCRLQLLQAPDVEVERVLHAVGQLALLERLAQIAHRVLDRVLGLEAEHALDLVGI